MPGIGIFTLDPNAVIPDEHNKDIHATALGIEFKIAPVTQADDDLIEYIRVHTGKIKPLAIADLESYLTLGTQLLNIGKPFYLEGIGTLTKDNQGRFVFTPGEYAVVKPETDEPEKTEKHGKRKSVLEESHFEPQPNQARKLLLIAALVVALVLIGWGGYHLYRKNNVAGNEIENTAARADTAALKPDSSAIASTDSLSGKKPDTTQTVSTGDSVLYKFNVLETANKFRALKRYNQLHSFDLRVFLYTADSSFFKVYFRFPALPRDTTHIKDSLRRVYAHEITIER